MNTGEFAYQMKNYHSPENFPKTLVFCKMKMQCVKIYMMFRKMASHEGLISMYHATLSEETKSFLHHHFIDRQSDLRCLVCTIAFGMVISQKFCMCMLSFAVWVRIYTTYRVWM